MSNLPLPNINDPLNQAGMAFGTLIDRVGNAVAETQNKLNDTGARTATALATTAVDVIAARETNYDDNGNITGDTTFTQSLPLINFIDPVFYQWTAVRVQGTFFAQKIAAETTDDATVSTGNSSHAQGGLLLIVGGGHSDGSSTSTTTSLDTTASDETSIGAMRLNAILSPRKDIGVPKPRQLIQGPSLAILPGEIKDEGPEGAPTGRSLAVTIEYRKVTGEAIQGQPLGIETDGVAWSYADPNVKNTDENGHLAIVLTRNFVAPTGDAPPPPPPGPSSFVVTARRGLVSNSTTVAF